MSYEHNDAKAIQAAFEASNYEDRDAFEREVGPVLVAYMRNLPTQESEQALADIKARRLVYGDRHEEAKILDLAIGLVTDSHEVLAVTDALYARTSDMLIRAMASIEGLRASEQASEANSAYNFANVEHVVNFLITEEDDYEIPEGLDGDPIGTGKTIVAHIQKLKVRIADLEADTVWSPL